VAGLSFHRDIVPQTPSASEDSAIDSGDEGVEFTAALHRILLPGELAIDGIEKRSVTVVKSRHALF
jgi:hypothetical protein